MSSQILKYLYVNLKMLRNVEVDDKLYQTKKMHKNINGYVNEYFIKNPHIASFMMNRSSSQYGGVILDTVTKNKMAKIASIFNAYNSIDLNAIVAKSNAIKIELDGIIQTIGGLDSNDSLTTVEVEDKILNNLNTIKMNTKQYADGMEINIKKSKIYAPIIDPFHGKPEYNPETIKSEFEKISQKIERYGVSIGKSKTIEDDKLLKLSKAILNLSGIVTTTSVNIDDIMTVLTKINREIENGVNYIYVKESIPIVTKLKDLKDNVVSILKLAISDKDRLFITGFVSIYDNFMKENSKTKEREVVQFYNENINEEFAKSHNLPVIYFDGKYTQRITNNFLLKDTDIDAKLGVLKTMIPDENVRYATATNITSFGDLFVPDFSGMKEQTTTIGVSPAVMFGGGFPEILETFVTLTENVNNYYKKIEDYRKEIKKYNVLQLRVLTYTLFQTLIVTNQMFEDDHIIYNYINVGTLTFYERIINTIMHKINRGDTTDEILFFKKYYFMVLQKLESFVHALSEKIEPDEIIDIKKCKDETANCFVLLNYFKDILESYNSKYMNKITIYARINDLRKPIDIKTMQLDKYQTEKMFMSDFDRVKFKEKYNQSDTNNFTSKFIKGSHQTDLDYLLGDKIDSKMMHINARACADLNADLINTTSIKKYGNLQPLNTYKFTEVFDSVRFSENNSITKYMTLDTQISKGKGVAIMTYGYSGTGKTFTLFGNSESGKQGLLQATLDSITGLKWVKFRLFELYGYGLTYPHYWTRESDGHPRTDNIEHKIYEYKMNIGMDSLKLSNPSTAEKKATEIKSYIDDHTHVMKDNSENVTGSTYNLIPGNLVSEVFRNIDNFMDSVDKVRMCKDEEGNEILNESTKMNKRIRDTPNNIVSSRSVLIYDFIIRVGDRNVPFLIIDLPGREEIVESYVKPFLENAHIKNLIALSYGANYIQYIDELKMLLITMALNPIAVPIFAPDIIFDFINKCPNRKKIFDEVLEMKFDVDLRYNLLQFVHTSYRTEELIQLLQSTQIEHDDKLTYDTLASQTPLSFQTELSINKDLREELTYQIDKISSARLTYNVSGDKFKITHVRDNKSIRGFKLSEECINRSGTNLGAFMKIGDNNELTIGTFHGFGYESANKNKTQYKALVGIHFINRLIMMGEFEILHDMFKEVVDKKLNRYLLNGLAKNTDVNLYNMLQESGFKGELLNSSKDKSNGALEKLIIYDYYLTPLEGIYINENIAGLIKFLAGEMISDKTEKQAFLDTLELTMKQPEGLNFQFQQKMARVWLMLNKNFNDQSTRDFFNFNIKDTLPKPLISGFDGPNNMIYDINNLNETFNTISTSYNSSKIFNFKIPLITDILTPYLDEISDYKVFYLFGNYEGDDKDKLKNLKCAHQYTLLENTKDFVNVISKSLE